MTGGPAAPEAEVVGRHLKDLSDAEFRERYGCDRFTASVLGSRFRYIVKHMCTHLMTNAFSPILRDWYDFCATLSGPPELDYPMSAVADSLIVFTGTMSEAVRNTVAEYGPENLTEGDVVLCNDPYRTGTHINDVCFIRPVFSSGRLVGFVTIQPHMIDMGGSIPGGFSPSKRTIYENGLVIPPMLLYHAGEPVRSTFSLLFDNVRFAEMMLQDIRSIASDLILGERLLRETIDRYGLDAYLGALRYATDVSAEAMRNALLAALDGVYVGDDLLDADGVDDTRSYLIRAKVTIAGGRAEVDLSGTSRQARTSINTTWMDTKTSVAAALKFLLDPRTPFTSGVFRHVDIAVPAGTILSSLPPDGPTTVYGRPMAALMIAIYRALANALGRDAIAGDYADSMSHNANGRRADGSMWVCVATCGGEHGPWGGTKHGDGENSLTIPIANSIAPSVEQIEADTPVVLLRKEYATDTAGAGVHRGGASTLKDTLWLAPSDHYVTAAHLKRAAGFGVYGGADGVPGTIWLWPADGQPPHFVGTDPAVYADAEPVAGLFDPETHERDPVSGEFAYFGRKPVWSVEAGAVFRYHTSSGGGWGNPLERPAERVLLDVRDEYFSKQFAREVFGVVVEGDVELDPEGLALDAEATAELRARLARARDLRSDDAADGMHVQVPNAEVRVR